MKMPEFPSLELIVKTGIEDYFQSINRFYVDRGLWWRVVPGHYWVELRID